MGSRRQREELNCVNAFLRICHDTPPALKKPFKFRCTEHMCELLIAHIFNRSVWRTRGDKFLCSLDFGAIAANLVSGSGT